MGWRLAIRSEEVTEMSLPREWIGERLEVFMGFENSAQTLVSNIIHISKTEPENSANAENTISKEVVVSDVVIQKDIVNKRFMDLLNSPVVSIQIPVADATLIKDG